MWKDWIESHIGEPAEIRRAFAVAMLPLVVTTAVSVGEMATESAAASISEPSPKSFEELFRKVPGGYVIR